MPLPSDASGGAPLDLPICDQGNPYLTGEYPLAMTTGYVRSPQGEERMLVTIRLASVTMTLNLSRDLAIGLGEKLVADGRTMKTKGGLFLPQVRGPVLPTNGINGAAH